MRTGAALEDGMRGFLCEAPSLLWYGPLEGQLLPRDLQILVIWNGIDRHPVFWTESALGRVAHLSLISS